MTTTDTLLGVAHEAVDLAAALIRDNLPGAVSWKGDRDMVSELDVLIERTIRDFLSDRTPDIGFLGEEESDHCTSSAELVWTLDPIDGTANLLHGLPLCGVSLGLIDGTRPIIGVIDLPYLSQRYSAAHDLGAYSGDRRLRASTTTTLNEAIISIGDYAVGTNSEDRNKERLSLTSALATTVQRVRMFGSAAIDLAWVAEGRLDGCVMLSNKPWDTAAGTLIAREAGAVVTDYDGSPHDADSRATIAVNKELAPGLLKLVQESMGWARGSIH